MKWPWQKPEQRNLGHDALLPYPTTAGPLVTAGNSESISTVFACVQAISETIAGLPLVLYRRENDGDRVRAPEYPLYRVLHDTPNERQTALEFREQMQASVLLRGNAYAIIETNGKGECTGLDPVQADRVSVLKLSNGRIAYDIADDNGNMRRYLQEEVLHLKDRSDNGFTGRSRIAIARDALGLAMAQQSHGAHAYASGTRLSGVLETPQQMSEEGIKRLSKSWRDQFSGTENTGKTAILENGLQYKSMSMTLEDAEWLAAMQFSVEETARIFRVPPTMIGDLRHGNYSNSVEMARVFVSHTLRRWLVMWEQAISQSLLGPIARGRYFAEHSVEGLLRGDSNARAEFYSKGIGDGWLMPSEARRLENLPTIEGIDNARQAAQA